MFNFKKLTKFLALGITDGKKGTSSRGQTQIWKNTNPGKTLTPQESLDFLAPISQT